MSIVIPTAPAPINTTTVQAATPPVFQSGTGGVSVTVPQQQSVTVSGSAIFGGQHLSVDNPAGFASVAPPALPPVASVEPLFSTLTLSMPQIATAPAVTVVTFKSEQGIFHNVEPTISGTTTGQLPTGYTRLEFITFNDADGGALASVGNTGDTSNSGNTSTS